MEAINRHGKPEILNTDQGCQFTSLDFTGLLKDNGELKGLGSNILIKKGAYPLHLPAIRSASKSSRYVLLLQADDNQTAF